MIDLNASPSRQLSLLSCLARGALGLVLAACVLLAGAWGVLHGWIVPRIGDWRGHLERIATDALGAPVRIAALSAHADGWFPLVEVQGLRVLDARGHTALELPSVRASVSLRSLLRRGLEQLQIDAPTLEIRHLPGGGWQVAGLDVLASADASSDAPALRWLMEQPELHIRQGQVRLTDVSTSAQATVTHWRGVELVVRNGRWQHALHLQATPDGVSGESVLLQGQFRRPLLPSSQPVWQRWAGQWYVQLQVEQLPQLPWPQAWGVAQLQAQGAVRMWVDVEHGKPYQAVADVALPQAQVFWKNAQLPALQLTQLHGRLQARWQAHGWQISASEFGFAQGSGPAWPRSNWKAQAQGPYAQPHTTQLSLDYADLALARQVAQSLPLPDAVQQLLQRWQPEGTLRQAQLIWQSSGYYQASGQVAGLSLQSQPVEQGVGTPGVEGVDATFTLNADGGQAQVTMQQGMLHFPGVFEEAAVPIDALQAQLDWTVQDGQVALNVPALHFANADAQGHLQAAWRMGSSAQDRLPGHLDLNGTLTRADGARVYRYLPLAVGETARHYVRDTVLQGDASDVQFEVRGNLVDMPFKQPGSGRFYIHAPVRNVRYDFAPQRLLPVDSPAWPVLQDVSGDLVFDGASMAVQHAQARFAAHPAVHMAQVEASIPDLAHPHLVLKVAGQSSLQAMGDVVKASPLAGMTGHALDALQATGIAELAFDLNLPIAGTEQAQVRGHVGLQGNQVHLMPAIPVLEQVHGQVQFSEQGFQLHQVRGQAVGGPVSAKGGMSGGGGVHIQVLGTATAQGLKSYHGVPVLPWVAPRATGQTDYSVQVYVAAGAQTVVVRSSLKGLAVDLPAPLHKEADRAWPLVVAHSVVRGQPELISVEVADRLLVAYAQDPSFSGGVIGQIMVGNTRDAPMPSQGVMARVQLPSLDADAWLRALQEASQGSGAAAADTAQAYWPQRIQLDLERLQLRQRQLDQVKADVVHSAGVWRGQLQAPNFGGYVEYRAPNVASTAGRVFARLTHLRIPKAVAASLEQPVAPNLAPDSLPALDIEVGKLEVAGKDLGQLSLQAHNRMGEQGREWALQQFTLSTPEAHWQASGFWQAAREGVPGRTQLSFLLSMDSAGQLLERFGMADVIRAGQGRLNGHIAWQGSPINPDMHSMDGQVHMQVDKGQFLKVEPGMGKLLSVLSLQSLSRRAVLDFRDVFSQGFAFDFIRGDVRVQQGVASTNNLQMKGLNAAVLMEGQTSLADATQDLRVVVVPEINAMTASLAATAINPVVGLGSFLAQMFLRGPLMEAATRTFWVHGTWSDPVVEPLRKPASLPAQELAADAGGGT